MGSLLFGGSLGIYPNPNPNPKLHHEIRFVSRLISRLLVCAFSDAPLMEGKFPTSCRHGGNLPIPNFDRTTRTLLVPLAGPARPLIVGT